MLNRILGLDHFLSSLAPTPEAVASPLANKRYSIQLLGTKENAPYPLAFSGGFPALGTEVRRSSP